MTKTKITVGVILTTVVCIVFIEPMRDWAINLLIGSVQTMNSLMIGQMPIDSPYLSSMNWANSLLGLVPALLTFGGLATIVSALVQKTK